jgi:TRAP-type C4-dicarboxylate transport system substrate-binding protein
VTARAVLAVALAVGAAACAGAGGDKAGGASGHPARTVLTPVEKQVTLTLVAVDSVWAEEFAAATSRLSGGRIRIRIRYGGNAIVDYERTLVGHVRTGRADLASVGARVWDRMGVTSFQGLLAPLLVDSLELEQRVLESPRGRRALDGVEPLGLVGLAVLPGPLRRPFGLARPLLGPADYRGATVGIRYGSVAERTLAALGATPKGYRIGALGRVDAAELDVGTIENNRYDVPGAAVTANVALWPRPETIVISRAAFTRLPPAQRAVLRRAGREAVAPVRARVEREQREALAELCGRGTLTLARASATDVARLRAAVRPVVAALARDGATRRLVAETQRLGRSVPADELRCEGAAAGARGLGGRWAARGDVATLELRGGQWRARAPGRSWSGTYLLEGSRLRLVLERCSHNPCDPGAATVLRWSLFRDTLSLTPVSGRPPWPTAVSAWRRAP